MFGKVKEEKEFIVPQSHVGLLYEDGAFIKALKPGKYELKKGFRDRVDRRIDLIDVRERSLTIRGQEITTADKVAIRVSLLVYFKVLDPEAAAHNVASYEDRIYEDVQLSARRYLVSRNLEAIMNDRNEISDAVKSDVSTAAETYGVEIRRADVKDLVFPGQLREIMNQVLETERRAEARLIEAKKNAEAQRVKNEAEHEAELQRLKTMQERIRMTAEAEKEKAELNLQAELEQAKAVAEHPELLKLRQLEALREMAAHGGRFVLGLEAEDLKKALD